MRSKHRGYARKIQKPKFLFVIHVSIEILKLCETVSVTLQTAGPSASYVKSLTEVLRTDLQSLRNDEKFNEVLQISADMSSDLITKNRSTEALSV